MLENNSKDFLPTKKVLVTIIIVSLVVGGAAGAAAGVVTASLSPNLFKNFAATPFNLNLGKLANTNNQNNQNLNVPQAALDEEAATTAAVKKVMPAVVSIVISKEVQTYTDSGVSSPFDNLFNSPFGDIFNQVPESQQTPGPKVKQTVGGGTGFIISSEGLIITNKHVVEDANAEYTVVMSDGKKYPAVVLARDPLRDLAFIKISGHNFPTAAIGDSDTLQQGQTVIAIGYSLGEYSNSVTKGIISGIGRSIVAGGTANGSETLEGVIQTDAAINPGNSGGPLINLAGQVIGINTAVNQQGQLIGFAIPINTAKKAIQSVQSTGKIARPYLGIRYIIITDEIAKANNLKYNYGALVVKGKTSTDLAIIPGSPADKAGIVENDIILEANGAKIDENHSLSSTIANLKAGDKLNLKIYHKGELKNVTVTLENYPQ